MDKAEYVFEKIAIMKIPNWAKPFATNKHGVVHIHTWPKSERLKAKLQLLQGGRLNAPLFRKTTDGWNHPTFAGNPGTGKPMGGWPKNSVEESIRRKAGRG